LKKFKESSVRRSRLAFFHAGVIVVGWSTLSQNLFLIEFALKVNQFRELLPENYVTYYFVGDRLPYLNRLPLCP
jgi:hypothetical protein